MTALDTVRPRPRVFWADARFLIGVVLVIASIAGVWFVVTSARQTVPVLAAAHTIVPGQPLSGDDVRVVDVALGQVGASYLEPTALEAGVVATRTIGSGELVPRSAIGDAAKASTTNVVVRSAVDVPASVRTGSVVEVWEAPLIEHGRYDTPRVLVADAAVVSVTRDEGMVTGTSVALELVVARADVAGILAAMSDDSALSVVPTTAAQ
ncbi:SAF domain-containing protein [Microbacterium sp. BWT-B31]|uniref:SAF domain-containing protein n=1 Tax=Microbacterium sp. BWT-B31 TaxID=3232072 RepID=UPI003526CA62